MSRPLLRNVALRDQITALLRDRGVMTTTEIGEATGARFDVYRQLTSLAKKGVLLKVEMPAGFHSVAWMLVTDR